MKNATQLERYKKLLSYLDERFKEEINIDKVEAISHYSYRNINRIFEALHHETIGKYIKRRRMEKAAEFLKYGVKGFLK
jgi:AraC family transcriptional regulator